MSQIQPQAPTPGPIPPALLAILAAHQQAAGGAPGTPPQPGPAPQPQGQPQPEASDDERQPIAILKQMIDLGNQFVQVEPDAADKATMAKLLATLHQYLAKEQSDAEAALGGGPATRLLRRI